MANSTKMFGLKPVRDGHGRSYMGQHRKYYAPATYATALYVGDPVIRTGTANATVLSSAIGSAHAIGSINEVNLATLAASNRITGVVVGFEPIIDNFTLNYGKASAERLIKVADDPGLIFHVRDDGAAALTASTVGLNAILITGTPSTVTGLSGVGLDTNATVPAANSAYQLLILGLAEIQDNAVGANAIWEVRIINHTEADGMAVTGI